MDQCFHYSLAIITGHPPGTMDNLDDPPLGGGYLGRRDLWSGQAVRPTQVWCKGYLRGKMKAGSEFQQTAKRKCNIALRPARLLCQPISPIKCPMPKRVIEILLSLVLWQVREPGSDKHLALK